MSTSCWGWRRLKSHHTCAVYQNMTYNFEKKIEWGSNHKIKQNIYCCLHLGQNTVCALLLSQLFWRSSCCPVFFCLLLVAWPPNQQLNLIQLLELWHIWGAVAESAPFEPLAASEDLPLPYGEEGTDGHSPRTPHVEKYINKNTIFENLD